MQKQGVTIGKENLHETSNGNVFKSLQYIVLHKKNLIIKIKMFRYPNTDKYT
jgi:hypothetical protein